MVLNAAKWKSMSDPFLKYGKIIDSWLEPRYRRLIPEGISSLVDWIKVTVRLVYTEKVDFHLPPRIS